MGLSAADADALDVLENSYSQAQIVKSPIAYSRMSAGMRLDDNDGGREEFSSQDASRISQSASQNSRLQEEHEDSSQYEDDAPESERAAPPKYSAADIAQQLKAAAEELLRKC